MKNYCLNCMEEKGEGNICPHCGFDENNYEHSAHHLPMGTVLAGKYLVGKVLGEGGFGITYMGIDLNLEIKMAIKEYYPNGFVTRENNTTVFSYKGEKGEFFISGKEKFLDEAKTLAKFRTKPGVVSVSDFFAENSTAYIVMEYIDGMTFKSYLSKMGGKLPSEQVFEMMKPVIKTLGEIHAVGMIHRDISPDNLMISHSGDVKLLDFGAARNFTQAGNKSLSVMLKPGYAPEEQYRSRGIQGPWTDIYALCATIYKCITGITPDEANERMRSETLVAPSGLGVYIDPAKEMSLLKGLSVYQEGRQQSVNELLAELYVEVVPVPQNTQYIPQTSANTSQFTSIPQQNFTNVQYTNNYIPHIVDNKIKLSRNITVIVLALMSAIIAHIAIFALHLYFGYGIQYIEFGDARVLNVLLILVNAGLIVSEICRFNKPIFGIIASGTSILLIFSILIIAIMFFGVTGYLIELSTISLIMLICSSAILKIKLSKQKTTNPFDISIQPLNKRRQSNRNLLIIILAAISLAPIIYNFMFTYDFFSKLGIIRSIGMTYVSVIFSALILTSIGLIIAEICKLNEKVIFAISTLNIGLCVCSFIAQFMFLHFIDFRLNYQLMLIIVNLIPLIINIFIRYIVKRDELRKNS